MQLSHLGADGQAGRHHLHPLQQPLEQRRVLHRLEVRLALAVQLALAQRPLAGQHQVATPHHLFAARHFTLRRGAAARREQSPVEGRRRGLSLQLPSHATQVGLELLSVVRRVLRQQLQLLQRVDYAHGLCVFRVVANDGVSVTRARVE